MLCGGRLRSRSSTRPASLRVSRSLSRRSTAMTPRSARLRASEGADLDGNRRRDRSVEARVDVIRADLTHRFSDVEVAPVETRPKLLLDRGDDVGCGQRAIQAALGTSFGFYHDWLSLEAALQLAGGALFVRGVPHSGSLQVGHLLERGVRGSHGKAARDQEVTRVPVGDLFDLAGPGYLGDVLLEKYLHDRIAPPSRIEQVC